MGDRLEILRSTIDSLILEHEPENSKHFFIHIYAVSKFCSLLALIRGLNPELASSCGMLHDIYQVTDGVIEGHGEKGAVVAKNILTQIGLYTDEEIDIITNAIIYHGKKRKTHKPYDEVLKDADVLSHCLYNTDYTVIDKEIERYGKLLAEFGVKR